MAEEQILDKVIREKMQSISILEGKDICTTDQINSGYLDRSFPNLVSLVGGGNLEGLATDKDVMTVFKLYHMIVYCSVMDIKLYRFVDHLLSSESKRTIIQSYANLFHSGVLKGTTSITLAKVFYMDLATTLKLQYGDILLATSTKSQLLDLIENDEPFFANNTHLVKTCIFDSQCDGARNIIGDLGKTLTF